MTELPLNTKVSGTFSVSDDRENFFGQYKTREEAVFNAYSELDIQPGQTFYTAENFPVVIRLCPDELIESAAQSAADGCSEIADDWLTGVTKNDSNELGKRLAPVFEQWLKDTKNEPRFFRCEHIQEHTYEPRHSTNQ
jgi:hypothetical protein